MLQNTETLLGKRVRILSIMTCLASCNSDEEATLINTTNSVVIGRLEIGKARQARFPNDSPHPKRKAGDPGRLSMQAVILIILDVKSFVVGVFGQQRPATL